MNTPAEFSSVTTFQITEKYLTCENGVIEYQFFLTEGSIREAKTGKFAMLSFKTYYYVSNNDQYMMPVLKLHRLRN